MNNILRYKGYFTKIEYSSEDQLLFGKIEGIRDLVNFESDSATGIEKEFHSAVDDYIQSCKDLNLEPDKPFKGSFNIRINPDLHRKAYFAALKEEISLNKFTENALNAYISKDNSTLQININSVHIELPDSEKTISYSVEKDNIYNFDSNNIFSQ